MLELGCIRLLQAHKLTANFSHGVATINTPLRLLLPMLLFACGSEQSFVARSRSCAHAFDRVLQWSVPSGLCDPQARQAVPPEDCGSSGGNPHHKRGSQRSFALMTNVGRLQPVLAKD
eukprot:5446799-Amphidinium_carterae.1